MTVPPRDALLIRGERQAQWGQTWDARRHDLERVVRHRQEHDIARHVAGRRVPRREHDVLAPVVTPMMEQVRVQIPLRIPKEGAPSFWSERARIEWWLRLRLRMRGCPNTESSFQIEVLPAVVER